jgi:hypothetical protein
MPELFKSEVMNVDSPRMKWLKRYNLSIGKLPSGKSYCVGETACGYGDTTLDSEIDFCQAHEMNGNPKGEKIVHYSITEVQKAGVIIPEQTAPAPANDFEF